MTKIKTLWSLTPFSAFSLKSFFDYYYYDAIYNRTTLDEGELNRVKPHTTLDSDHGVRIGNYSII